MGKNEKTGKRVGKIASKGLRKPTALSSADIRALAASALTQRPNKGGKGKKKR